MSYDVPFRHHQALNPSALTSITTALHAITRGIEDCRNAGVHPDSDPAILLLARHIGHIAGNQAGETALRGACRRRIAELDRFPALLALSLRGVAFDKPAKDRFHSDGRKAMRQLATALGLAEGTYTVTSHPGDIAIAGDVVLSSSDIEVAISVGPLHEGNEVRYFAKRGPAARERLRFARMSDFLKVERFAARLRRELRLTELTGSAQGTVPASTPIPAASASPIEHTGAPYGNRQNDGAEHSAPQPAYCM